MKIIFLLILTSAILLFNPGALSAAHIEGFYFHDSDSVGGEILGVRGAGVLKWLFFRIYIAALYLPPDVMSGNALDDVPKKMEFYYLMDMQAEQFAEAGASLLPKNASPDELERISEEINAINNMYRDVKKGERYSLTYIPGQGTELALNGKVLGRITGYLFAAVYYRIWLGENPVDDDLKHMLLNNAGWEYISN